MNKAEAIKVLKDLGRYEEVLLYEDGVETYMPINHYHPAISLAIQALQQPQLERIDKNELATYISSFALQNKPCFKIDWDKLIIGLYERFGTHKISEEKIAKIIKNIKDEDGYRVYLNQNPYRLAKAILKAIEDL